MPRHTTGACYKGDARVCSVTRLVCAKAVNDRSRVDRPSLVDLAGFRLGHRRTAAAANAAAAGRKFKAAIVYYAHGVSNDYCVNGLLEGLKASGIEQGKNLEVVKADAQVEMINIPAILQNYGSSDVDLIMTISTPCLAGACNTVKHKKVVFTCVSDPIAAGAGKSHMEHLPFLTGVGSFPPVSHMLDFMQKLVPGLRAVGTMYNPAARPTGAFRFSLCQFSNSIPSTIVPFFLVAREEM